MASPPAMTSTTDDSGTDINYLAVSLPDDTPPAEYSYVERRKAVLDEILDAGSPRGVNQTALADRYGVSQSTISNDIAILGDELASHLADAIELETLALAERVKAELMAEGKYKQAWDVHLDYVDWLGYESVADTLAAEKPNTDIDSLLNHL